MFSSQGITRDSLLKLRGDLSPYLIHLTRDGVYTLKKDIPPFNERDKKILLNAKQSLIDIITQRKLEARQAFGYFNYQVNIKRPNGSETNPNSLIKRSWLQSVCFTETPVDHVHIQCKKILGRQLNFKPYGLAFFESSVRPKGNPVFYFDSSNLGLRSTFDALVSDENCKNSKEFLPLVEPFGRPIFSSNSAKDIDFRWEREWRVVGNYDFSLKDVAFGLCKEEEITEFEKLVSNVFPFIDPEQPMELVKSKLREWPQLQGLK